MDSQLICDFYNMDLGVEQGSKVDPLEAVRKKILKFFRKYCPEILDPSLLPDEIDAKHFMGFDVELWFSGEPLRVRRINPADPPHAHFVLFQRHWSRVVELINNFVDHQKLTGSDWNWLRKKLLMVPIRFFELPKGVLVDQGMLDRPKVGYSRGVGLVDREGKTIVGPNMYMEAEFKVVSLDEHKLGYTEYFSANTAWEMISEILYEVTHLMVGILTETIEVYRCAAMETPKRDKCRNLISHKRCPGPRRLYCSSQCKRRTSEHAKRNDIKLYEYYVDEGYV